MNRPLRRGAGSVLLLVTLAGSLAAHHHSLFSADDGSGRDEDRAVTRHNPRSHASHWHAVLAFIHEHECVVCKNQRLAGLPVQGRDPAPAMSARFARPVRVVSPPVSPRLSTASRAPPVLL